MKTIKFLILGLLSCLFINLTAQNTDYNLTSHKIRGSVIDAVTKEKLAFVNIIINDDGTLGTTSDIDGNFSINTKKEIRNLTFSFVGYEKKVIDITHKDYIIVKLKPITYRLSDIVIDGNNDPANRIIDSVFKYMESNNPNNLDSYYYKIYDNMVFTIDTTLVRDSSLLQIINDNYLMAMETVSEQYYHKPNKSRKNILANKFSGSKNPMFIYLIENIQNIGFYDDLITIDTKKYVNPISKNSKKKYIFSLESAYKNESNDSIYTIVFAPQRNTSFNSLRGTITINSDNWAIQNIKVKPYIQNELYNIEIQQMYDKVNDEYWFPKQLNTTITTFDKDKLSEKMRLNPGADFSSDILALVGIGKSYITDVKLNPQIDKETFNNIDYSINDNAGKSGDFIINYRYDSLSSEKIEATYHLVDSLFQKNNINIDYFANSLSSISIGKIPISIFDLDLNKIIDYNIGNGFMLGLGINTNNRMSKIFSIGGFGNYWFTAEEFNYGGDITFNLLRSKDMKLNISASHEFEKLGDYGFTENTNIINPSIYQRLYINATSLNNAASIGYSTYFNRNFKGFVNFEIADKMIFKRGEMPSNEQQTYRISSLDFKLRIGFSEKFVMSENGLKVEGYANPVIWLLYKKNIKDLFNSPYNYDKMEFQFRGSKEFPFIGITSINVQAGIIDGFTPATELFNISGTGYNKFDIYCSESFSTMLPDEFFCDRFTALYFSHNFKNLLLNFKNFHPEIMIVTNIAIGKLNKNNKFIDGEYKDLSKGFYESGMVINFLNIAFIKYGLGIFYRYGPYSNNKAEENLFFKINIGFEI